MQTTPSALIDAAGLHMSPAGLYRTGLLTALGVSALSLGLDAQVPLAQMRLNPAQLLRSGG